MRKNVALLLVCGALAACSAEKKSPAPAAPPAAAPKAPAAQTPAPSPTPASTPPEPPKPAPTKLEPPKVETAKPEVAKPDTAKPQSVRVTKDAAGHDWADHMGDIPFALDAKKAVADAAAAKQPLMLYFTTPS